MKTTIILGLTCLAASTAIAQPGGSPPAGSMLPTDLDDPPAVPEPPPPPPPDLEPPPEAGPPPAPIMIAPPSAPPERRPSGFTIGMGLGYTVPADLSVPNLLSVRFRLGSGLTFEPTVALASTSDTDDDGTTSTTDSTTDLELGTTVRYPLRMRGRVDLALLGNAFIGRFASNPEGPDNNSSTTQLSLGWGLGLDYWINANWGLSMSATNPIVVRRATSNDNGTGPDLSQSNTTIGAIFSPRLAVMLHLYL